MKKVGLLCLEIKQVIENGVPETFPASNAGPTFEPRPRRTSNRDDSKTLKKKEAFRQNVIEFVKSRGISHCRFLTLTTPDPVSSVEIMRRFNCLGRILSTRTNGWIRVIEKGKNGSWHLHIILALKEDFLDISGMKEQKSWQETLQKYKFGRVQLKKLSDPNGLARYLSKEFGNAELGNKVRRVGYSRGSRTVSLEFAWRGGKSQNIRSLFTERFGPDNGTLNLRDIYKAFLGGYLH